MYSVPYFFIRASLPDSEANIKTSVNIYKKLLSDMSTGRVLKHLICMFMVTSRSEVLLKTSKLMVSFI